MNNLPEHNNKIILGTLCVTAFGVMMNLAAIPTLIPRIALSYSISNIATCRIIPAYMISYGLSALLYAPLSKKTGKKIVIIITVFSFSIFSFICGIVNSIFLLILFRSLTGIVSSAIIPLSLALIADIFPNETRGKAVGFFLSSISLASVLGVFIGGLISWKFMFFIPAFIGLVAEIFIMKFVPQQEVLDTVIRTDYLSVLFSEKGKTVYSYILLTALLNTATFSWLGVFLHQEIHMTKFMIAVFFTVSGLGSVLGALCGGIISDMTGRNISVLSGLVFLAMAIYMLNCLESRVSLMVIALFFGIGRSICQSSLVTMVTDLQTPNKETATALNSFIRFLAGGSGASITEIILSVRDFRFAFKIYAHSCIVLGILSFPFLKKAGGRLKTAESNL